MNSNLWPVRVAIYAAGEAIDGANALAPAIQAQLARLGRVATNRRAAALVQLDASDVPTQRYVLDPWGRQPIYALDNVDVGDPAVLVDFAGWASAVCPAERSVLVLSGHGAAWQDAMVGQVLAAAGPAALRSVGAPGPVAGAIHHPRTLFGESVNPTESIRRAVLVDGHDRDYLSNVELGSACAQVSQALGAPIDVLVFDACLMSAWEILHEIEGSVRCVVASIDELSVDGIDLARPVAAFTAAVGSLDAVTLAATIAGDFTPQAAFDSCVAIDLSGAEWASALVAFAAFCAAFLAWLDGSGTRADDARAALRYAATSVVQYSGGGLADIGALADAVCRIPAIPAAVSEPVTRAVASLAACVKARSAGQDYRSATGLSIFAPNSATVYAANRDDYAGLAFSGATGWGAVLESLYGPADETT